MRTTFSPEVDKELQKIKQKDRRLAQKVEKQLILFAKDPTHPSLRKHKLSGNLTGFWSISITKSIRMVYRLAENEEAYFVDIGTHDQVYRK